VDQSIWKSAEESVKRAIYSNKDVHFQVFDAGVKWQHLVDDRHYSKCTTSSLVAVAKADGDIPLCVLKRHEPGQLIGNIYEGGFIKNWFSQRHEELINNIDVSTCRKPCKHDSYNIVCEALKNDLYHRNFI
jgi:sulfatase maturation enzyme AslB (radical SAM superfamily)